MRRMYFMVSVEGTDCIQFKNPPREVLESFETGNNSYPGCTQYTNSGVSVTTQWTTTLISEDFVWVEITHPYENDIPMYAAGNAYRLAKCVALEADAVWRDIVEEKYRKESDLIDVVVVDEEDD